ncbi:MAG: hypothetical protein CMH64_00525 [Nanoarchaeota archaeon]|nr:hypothetical protein [Nanoarchaeota archaeon]|tara:strand:- start:83 stop:421 length:339 start_codon:yes stop_codon:yes gene_type:complete
MADKNKSDFEKKHAEILEREAGFKEMESLIGPEGYVFIEVHYDKGYLRSLPEDGRVEMGTKFVGKLLEYDGHCLVFEHPREATSKIFIQDMAVDPKNWRTVKEKDLIGKIGF